MKFSFENIFTFLMLLIVFSLAFVFPFFNISGQRIPFTDFLFLPVFLCFLIGAAKKKFELKFHIFFALAAFYLFSIFISVVFSLNPKDSFIKFLGEIYLVLLAFVTFNFVGNIERAKKLTLAWLAGTIFVLLICLLTIFLFYTGFNNSLAGYFLNHYGTVPVGNYPRLKATFFHSNMLCNYLSVSLMLAFAANKTGWLNPSFCKVLIGLILIFSFFTFSPGLGGIALGLGIFYWLIFKSAARIFLSKSSLLSGAAISLVFFCLLFFAMQKHPTAPFVYQIPFIEKEFYPSSRVMVWTAALKTFQNNYWNGVGLDQDVCHVRYLNPSGVMEDLRDGHNTILNVSAQTGILGLISILTIIFFFLGKIFNFKDMNSKSGVFYNCCGIAILSAFIYQGLSGSFEETRHLWVLFGIFLSADRFFENQI